MNVTDIINAKGNEVIALPPTATVWELAQLLAEKRIGSVVVLDHGTLVGIVSERDVVRFYSKDGLATTPIAEIMSTALRTCNVNDDLREVAQTMTSDRVRHLPVLHDDGELAGLISIGDVVKARLDDLEAERDHLERYVRA